MSDDFSGFGSGLIVGAAVTFCSFLFGERGFMGVDVDSSIRKDLIGASAQTITEAEKDELVAAFREALDKSIESKSPAMIHVKMPTRGTFVYEKMTQVPAVKP